MSKEKIDSKDLMEATNLDWTSEQEYWNSYKLSDGTTLKVKLVLRGVKRLKKHTPDGAPVYMISSINVLRVLNVPRDLMAKPKPSTTPVA